MIIRPNAGFIFPELRFVDVGMPKSKVTAKGRYMLIKRDAWGKELERTPWFDNIILDSGLERWGTGAIILGAAIGTGTSTPVAAQTQLDTQTLYTTTAGTGAALSALGSSPYNNTRTLVYRTPLGGLNGNYTEVGVGWASGSNMFSRALILDGLGSPTTIAVNSAQQLDIIYQLSVYPPLTDIGPTVVNISGVDYDVTGRASNVNSTSVSTSGGWGVTVGEAFSVPGSASNGAWNGTMGLITASPSGSSGSSGTGAVDAYVASSLQRTGYASYSLGGGNVAGGISATWFGWNCAAFQYGFDPAIPKDGTKTLVLNYSVNWARRP